MRISRGLSWRMMVWAVGGCLACAGPIAAQGANPLARDGSQPDPTTQPLQGPGELPGAIPGALPGAVPGGAVEPIKVPEFIKPGARLIYTSMMTLEPKPGQGAAGTTDGGTSEFHVVAVLPDRVLFHITSYANALHDQKEYMLGGSSIAAVTANDVALGNTLWMDVEALAAMQSGQNINVTRGKVPLHGQAYDSTQIKIDGQDFTTITTYDSGTGLLLTRGSGTGNFRREGPRMNGLNREVQNSLQFETYRHVELPWHNAKRPAWADTIGSMTYRGTYRTSVAPEVVVNLQSEMKVTHRGDDWVTGTTTTRFEGQQPTQAAFVQGPGSPDGFWINPQVLRDMQPGVLDRNPFMGSTLSYSFHNGPMGKLGVLTMSSRHGNQRVTSAYSLEDGALLYAQLQQHDPIVPVTTSLEITLTDRKRAE